MTWIQTASFTSLSLSFVICKMGEFLLSRVLEKLESRPQHGAWHTEKRARDGGCHGEEGEWPGKTGDRKGGKIGEGKVVYWSVRTHRLSPPGIWAASFFLQHHGEEPLKDDGGWRMADGDGGWRVVEVRWRMEDGGWRRADGGWRMEDGKWQMVDGGWRGADRDGRWRMADGRWRMEVGGWRMVDGGWRMEDRGGQMAAPAGKAQLRIMEEELENSCTACSLLRDLRGWESGAPAPPPGLPAENQKSPLCL